DPVPEGDPPTEVAPAAAHRGGRRRHRGLPRGLRQHVAVQPRVPTALRASSGTRRGSSARRRSNGLTTPLDPKPPATNTFARKATRLALQQVAHDQRRGGGRAL